MAAFLISPIPRTKQLFIAIVVRFWVAGKDSRSFPAIVFLGRYISDKKRLASVQNITGLGARPGRPGLVSNLLSYKSIKGSSEQTV